MNRSKKVAALILILSVFSSLLTIGWFYIQNRFNNEALAAMIEKGFNKGRRGKIKIKRVHWGPMAVFNVISGRPVFVTVDNLKLYDSRGKVTVDVKRATGYVYIDPLRKNVSLVFENARASSGFINIEMYEKPDDPGSNEIGLLGLFQSKKSEKTERKKQKSSIPEKSWEISCKGFDISNLKVRVDLPGLDLNAENISLNNGSLIYRTRSSEGPLVFSVQATPKSQRVSGQLLGSPIDFRNVIFTRGYMDPREPMNLHLALKGTEHGGDFQATAHLGDHGITIDAHANKVADIATRFSRIFKFTDEDNSSGNVHIRGTLKKPVVYISGSGLSYKTPVGQKVSGISASLIFRKENLSNVIEFNSINGKIKGSPVHGAGAWDMTGGNLFMKFSGKNLKPREMLASLDREEIPDILDGSISIRMQYPFYRNILFGWKATGNSPWLSQMTSGGSFVMDGSGIEIRRGYLSGNEGRADLWGSIKTGGKLKLGVSLLVYRMTPLLRKFKINASMGKVEFRGGLSGLISKPQITGNLGISWTKASGIKLNYFSSYLSANRYGVNLTGISSGVSRGTVNGRVSVSWKDRLWTKAFLKINKVSLARLSGNQVSGQITGDINVKGPPSSLSGNVSLRTSSGKILGLGYRKFIGDISLKKGGVKIRTARLEFPESTLHLSGENRKNGKLDMGLKISGFMLDRAGNGKIRGSIVADLSVKGTPLKPLVNGTVAWEKPVVFGNPHSSGKISFSSEKGINTFEGKFFDLVALKGKYTFGKKTSLDGGVAFSKLNPQNFLPAGLFEKFGLKAEIFGTGKAVWNGGRDVEGNIRISGLNVLMTGIRHPFLPTRPVKKLSLKRNLVVTYRNNTVTLKPAYITGENTDLKFSGELSEQKGNLRIAGELGTAAIAYLVPQGMVESATGAISIEGNIIREGNSTSVLGQIFFAGNTIQLAQAESGITIRSGRITLEKGRAVFHKLRLVYEEEELELAGIVDLDKNMKISGMNLAVSGYVSSRLLALAMPGSLYSTSGRSRLSLNITGTPEYPKIRGELTFNEPNRIFFRNGREFVFAKGGKVEFRGKDINLNGFRVMIEDGYAEFNGRFTWENSMPYDVDIDIKLRNFSERASTFEVEAMGDLHLGSIGSSPMSLEGTIDLLSARYTKKYNVNLVDKLLTPVSRTAESSGSSIDNIKWLKNMKLNLTVQLTGDIEIDNNFAQTRLEGVMNVNGTVSSPKLGGMIALNGGTFRIPMLRGNYEIKEGLIDFDKAKLSGHSKDEPYIDVQGEMVFTDRNENEHIITLSMTGFVSQLRLKWSSSTGLNSSQVLTLLMLNRTPDEIRRGESGGLPDVGGILEGYVPMNLQLGLTSDNVKVYVEKKFMSEHLVLKGNVDFGFMGQQKQEASLIFRITDSVRIQGQATRKTLEEETTIRQDEEELQGKVELKYKIGLKGTWKDILGL
ncbi:MAG: translocation/assembly module TamB domain-containing protein [Deltaproteobacteria bacterium]|nr:translocation/assembly module TamB domain-containing protein [Deltaproteobacteria bacterium]